VHPILDSPFDRVDQHHHQGLEPSARDECIEDQRGRDSLDVGRAVAQPGLRKKPRPSRIVSGRQVDVDPARVREDPALVLETDDFAPRSRSGEAQVDDRSIARHSQLGLRTAEARHLPGIEDVGGFTVRCGEQVLDPRVSRQLDAPEEEPRRAETLQNARLRSSLPFAPAVPVSDEPGRTRRVALRQKDGGRSLDDRAAARAFDEGADAGVSSCRLPSQVLLQLGESAEAADSDGHEE
jgi:hypothetical protein